jgi:hypothetical protein
VREKTSIDEKSRCWRPQISRPEAVRVRPPEHLQAPRCWSELSGNGTLEGETIAQLLKHGPAPVEMVGHYGLQIAAALTESARQEYRASRSQAGQHQKCPLPCKVTINIEQLPDHVRLQIEHFFDRE